MQQLRSRASEKIPEFPEIEKEVDLDTGLLKENAVQFYSSVLEAPSQEEVEGYIKYSAKKLNECGFTGVQSDDLASLPGKNWRRIMASYKALDARGELSIRHYEQCLFERAEDAKAFIEEGYRTGQRGENFTIGPMKLIQDGSLGARTAAMNEPYEDAPGNTGIITFSQDELDDLFAFLTGIRCRRQYTVSVTGPWIWSLRLLRSLPSGKTTKRADMVSFIARSPTHVFWRK